MAYRPELNDMVTFDGAKTVGPGLAALRRMLGAQQAIVERLLDSLGAESDGEIEDARPSAGQRDVKRVERLLGGGSPDTSQIAYDFEGHHLGAIAKGPGAGEALRALAGSLDRRLLLVGRQEQTVWAWIGGRDGLNDLDATLRSLAVPPQTSLALGEPGHGVEGWRLTHRQAKAALGVIGRRPSALVRYREVAVLAAALGNELLTASLRELYLVPIEAERDGGKMYRATLRAYFVSQRNASSAAALLGVSRHTVTNRLRALEECIGRPLPSCMSELEIALAIHDLHQSGSHTLGPSELRECQ
jgi:PucR C-terminal helix-turn-helix domain/GGDEF-like domain